MNRLHARLRSGWGRLIWTATLLAIGLLLSIPLMGPMHAQQQVVNVPTAAAGAALLITGTTTFSTTALSPNAAGLHSTGFTPTPLTGNHDIYGYQFLYSGGNSVDICWIQVFDQQSASVTVGTTLPRFAFPIFAANSAGGVSPSSIITPIPLFNMTSTMTIAAASTVTGSTTCAGSNMLIVGHFLYK